jgi:hypothetical protein
MAHASLLDVWNAGARLGSQALDTLSKEKEYELDTQAFQESVELNKLQNKLVLEYTNTGAAHPYRSEPDKYTAYVTNELARWKDQAMRRGNNSRYYNDSIDRLYRKAAGGMGEKVLAAEIATENQRADNNYAQTLATIRNTAATADEMIAGYQEATEMRRKANGLDPATEAKIMDEGRRAALDLEIRFTPQAGTAVQQIEALFNQLASDGLAPGGRYTTVDGARETIETAKKGAVLAQKALNFNALTASAATYEHAKDEYLAALKGNDPNAIQNTRVAMERLHREGTAKKNWALIEGKDEYDSSREGQIISLFSPLPREDGKSESQKTTDTIKNLAYNFIQHQGVYVPAMQRGEMGIDINGRPMEEGYTLADVYTQLDRIIEEKGLDPVEVINEFTSQTYTLLKDDAPIEGKAYLNQFFRFNESMMQPLREKYGKDIDAIITQDNFTGIMNIMAEYGKMEAAAGNNAAQQKAAREYLEKALAQQRQKYSGDVLALMDLNKENRDGTTSSYARTGYNYRNLPDYLAFYNTNDQVAQPGRNGQGRTISVLHDDSLPAVQAEERNILSAFPGHGTITVSGSQVHMKQEDGSTYRMNKGGGNRVVLEKQEGGTWTPVARLETERTGIAGQPTVFIWSKLENGNPVRITDQRKVAETKRLARIDVENTYNEANDYLKSLYGNNPRNQTVNTRKAKAELDKQKREALRVVNEYSGYALFDGIGSRGMEISPPDYAVIRAIAETGRAPMTQEEYDILKRTYGEERVPDPRRGTR